MVAVEFKNVQKQLGDFKLDIPDLKIHKGYITGFIGKNGAGKTTTIKLILDALRLDGGEIKVDGLSTRENKRTYWVCRGTNRLSRRVD